jgi:hypothetical protein
MLQFIYAYFGGSSVGEADKIGKKNLIFLSSLMIVSSVKLLG